MSKKQFTPGPWRIIGGIKGNRLYVVALAVDGSSESPREMIVDSIDETHPIKEHLERRLADFKLRNRAPAMYELLEKWIAVIDNPKNILALQQESINLLTLITHA